MIPELILTVHIASCLWLWNDCICSFSSIVMICRVLWHHHMNYHIGFHRLSSGGSSDHSSNTITVSMSGLSLGCVFTHLNTTLWWYGFSILLIWFARRCGSGSSLMHISQRRTPKLYTSTWVRSRTRWANS